MNNLAINSLINSEAKHSTPRGISAYYDEGITANKFTFLQRIDNVEQVINRYFVGKNNDLYLSREAIARSLNPSDDFQERLREESALAEGGFGPELLAPSIMVEDVFYQYALTELGAVALARLIAWDNQFIDLGWRKRDGALTNKGILAYGEGRCNAQWYFTITRIISPRTLFNR